MPQPTPYFYPLVSEFSQDPSNSLSLVVIRFIQPVPAASGGDGSERRGSDGSCVGQLHRAHLCLLGITAEQLKSISRRLGDSKERSPGWKMAPCDSKKISSRFEQPQANISLQSITHCSGDCSEQARGLDTADCRDSPMPLRRPEPREAAIHPTLQSPEVEHTIHSLKRRSAQTAHAATSSLTSWT